MTPRERVALVARGAGTAGVGIVLTGLLTLGLWVAVVGSCGEHCDDEDGRTAATLVTGGALMILVPAWMATGPLRGTRRRMGRSADFAPAFQGALGGLALGGALGAGAIALAVRHGVPLETKEGGAGPAAAMVLGAISIAALSAGTFAMLTYDRADRRALELRPVLASTASARGLELGIVGRF